MTLRAAVLLLSMVPAAAGRPISFAQEESPARSPGAQEQFDALIAEIDALRSDLDWIDRRERTLVTELDRLEVEASLRSRELARLAILKERAAQDLHESRGRQEALRRQARRAEAGLSARLRDVYKMGRQREVRLVLAVTDPVDLLRGFAYLGAMTRRGASQVGALRRDRAEVEALERSHRALVQGLEEMTVQERSRRDALEGIRAQSAELLRTTREDRDAHRRAVAELTRAAGELEEAIVAAIGGGEPAPASVTIDMARLKGVLDWPVTGEVAVPYGDVVHPRFRTVTPHAGMEIRTGPASPIRAVLGGRVVFGRRFSGYGNTVLLDHGGEWLTVYAGAAVLKVAEGDDVLPGQILGHSADRDAAGGPPSVYFELRHHGKSVNPALWLKRAPSDGRKRGS